MLQKELSKVVLPVKEFVAKNYDGKPKIFQNLSAAEIAGLMKVKVTSLKSPIILSPSKLMEGQSSLSFYNCAAIIPTLSAKGTAIFNSFYQGATYPGVKVEFPKVAGKKYLVEFNVGLAHDIIYQFRITTPPGEINQDISVEGPQLTVLHALVQPWDDYGGAFEVTIDQFNAADDFAGWALYSVTITASS